eukprot:Nitzschia sp. Nitz4//scaffold49_size126201//25409//27032//NITZ4_003632-RA/size126201-augustus-gene-0.8-mRNA-1//-1//CDS//3329553119//4476//frame0
MADEVDFALFGDVLIKPSTGETAKPTDVLKNKVILLFFGAHWWEPCIRFTPKLHLFHQLQSKREEYEIVFCSMDRNEDEYKAYSETMPWWCLPYAVETLPTLTMKFHAHGMPHLVVIDSDRKLITRDGVDSLTQDPVGKNFPWRPIRIVDLLPEYYLMEENDDEAMIPFSGLDEKYILLYFASKADSLSQDFTPWLVKAYNILKRKRPDDFEMIFVSGDESQAGFYKYWSQLPFGAIPYEEQDAREGLETRLDITSYPTLVMIGPKPDEDVNNHDRPVINTEVRAVIENGDYITDFPFYPKPWGDLCKTTDDINMHKCLIVFHEGGDEEEQMDIEDAVREAAEEYRGDEYIKFYWANDGSDLSSNIREACGLGEAGSKPTMILLDIKSDGEFFISREAEITPITIKFFLVNYKDETRGQI